MRLLTLTALITLLTAGAAQAERFRYRFTPGRPIEMRVSLAGASMMGFTSTEMSKMQFRVQLRQVMRVRSVSGGVATLDVTETPLSAQVIADGQRESMKQPTERYTIRLTERGGFVSRKDQKANEDGEVAPGAMEAPGTDVLNHVFALNFPDRDLKPGDTWDATFPAGQDGQTARAVWKYVGKEFFRGRECAKITAQLTSQSQSSSEGTGAEVPVDNRISASVTTWFDPKAGVEVYSRGSVVVLARTDMSGLEADAGEFAVISKINYVQSQNSPARSGAPVKSGAAVKSK